MKERLKRALGRPSRFTVDRVTGQPSGRINLAEAEEFGIATVGKNTARRPTSPLIHVRPREEPRLAVGTYTMFGPWVEILAGGRHHIERVTAFLLRKKWGLHQFPFEERDESERERVLSRPITIGNDVWLASYVTILDGVTIGDGAIVCAKSVVTKDVEPYTIVGGNPAKTIRKRFTDEEIAGLLRIRWWDWPDEVIRERVDDLYTTDISRFVEKYDTARQSGGVPEADPQSLT
jgi:hypothetical protein